MTEREIILLTAKSDSLPQNAEVEERALHSRIRLLYRMFQDGIISAKEGEDLKRDAITKYHQYISERESIKKLQQNNVNLWRRIELATSAYCREPTIENADKIISALYGMDRKHICREENA